MKWNILAVVVLLVFANAENGLVHPPGPEITVHTMNDGGDDEDAFFEKFSAYFFKRYSSRLMGQPGFPCDVHHLHQIEERILNLEKAIGAVVVSLSNNNEPKEVNVLRLT